MSKKFKVKLLSFIVIASIGLTAGFFFSGLINFALTGLQLPGTEASTPAKNTSIAVAIAPDAILKSLKENHRHSLLLLGIEFIVVCGSAVVLLMGRRETYESDTRAVTGFIQTPVAVGQGQHGTARWLKQSERKKTFAVYSITTKNHLFAALLDAGGKDIKAVDDYSNEENGKDNGAGKSGESDTAKTKESDTPKVSPDTP